MAGYNSTFEALAAGQRPILMPRRNPRREQAIRAERLEGLGLADVVDPGADPSRRRASAAAHTAASPPAPCEAAGIDLDGARTAARRLHALSKARSVR